MDRFFPALKNSSNKLLHSGLMYTPDGINTSTVILPILIRFAYGGYMKFPTDDRTVGFPDWA